MFTKRRSRNFKSVPETADPETSKDRPEAEIRREARETALRRLSVREHSAKELEAYLKKKQIPPSIVTETVTQLAEEKLLDDPQVLRDLKKMFRGGMVEDTPTGAKMTHPDIKDRALYFRKIGERWYLEHRWKS